MPDAVADLEPALMPSPRLAIFVGNEMVIEGIFGNISTADGGHMAFGGNFKRIYKEITVSIKGVVTDFADSGGLIRNNPILTHGAVIPQTFG